MATVIISSGIISSGLAVTSGNGLEVYGTADATSVLSGGSATVFSGGKMTVTQIYESGYLDVCGGVANSNTVLGGGRVLVSSGGSTNVNSIHSGGSMTVGPAGRASLVANSGGILTVSSGGTAYIANATDKGLVEILDGGSGVFVTLADTGRLTISSGGRAEKVNLNGTATVYADGSASDVTVSDGGRFLVSGGFAQGVNVLAGGNAVLSGGSANNAAVASDGFLTVSSGATASGVEVNGWTTVMSGGMVDSVEVNPNGWLVVSSGGELTGQMAFAEGASVNLYGNSILDFDISPLAPGSDARINDLSLVHGSPEFTLTVSGSQTHGDYALAGGVTDFSKTISVINENGEQLGTLTVGQTADIGGTNYKLNLADSVLSVSVGSVEPASSAKSDIDGNGISDVLFVWTGNNYQHGYWMNGTSDWQSAGCNHPAEWENLGCYDMNANGKADSVLFGNVDAYEVPSAYIGYYQDGIDTDDNWVTIGFLTNAAGIDWKNKVGNLTGNEGMNSIVWHSAELGALGVWTDGTDTWVSLGGGYDENWTLVGCGDFDGDGKNSVLMSYAGGTKYYAVGIDETPADLGSADWSGWEVRAIGDFAGDGKDDLVLLHKETGSMVMIADGNIDHYTSIGQLDVKDWFVVGAGDYNADEKDDLLVRQISTGMLGYYDSGDTAQWVELGRGVDMNWTVVA
ncbi:MAG: AIDA repeat-containing protein [Lentisphaeria bacterium]|nr:AIDA repeat-containing protein [Lentisphaeria bacterium]